MKKIGTILLSAAVIISSCGLTNTASGSLIGSGAGAALGAGIGYLISKDGKGAAIRAAIGTAVGGGTGAIIGKQMDKKAEELAALNADVETVEDANGLKAIKVTFANGILFPTNGYKLTKAAQDELTKFAKDMADMPDTDITVIGHTDNTGTAEVNERLSGQRAASVANLLNAQGIAASRLKAEGHSFLEPVADNSTKEGRAQNRRVEVFISANADMIKAAEAEAKKQN